MKYFIKGNYFQNQYHLSPNTGSRGVERVLRRSNPSDTSEELWEAPIDYDHIPLITESSLTGFKSLGETTLGSRHERLKVFLDDVIESQDELATIIATETGYPLPHVQKETRSYLTYLSLKLGSLCDGILSEKEVIKKPIGPTLIAWGDLEPHQDVLTKTILSLLCGNSIVLISSRYQAMTAQFLFDKLSKIDLPEGAINLIHGDYEMVSRLTKERAFRLAFFYGQKEQIEKLIVRQEHDLTKLFSFALPPKNLALIDDSADLETVSRELAISAYHLAGQHPRNIKLALCPESLFDDLSAKLHQLAKEVSIDNPIQGENVDSGPLVDQDHLDSYLLFVGMAKREGFEELMRGKTIARDQEGYYVSPSLHLGTLDQRRSHFLKENIIGPNLTLLSYKNWSEAIQFCEEQQYNHTCTLYASNTDLYTEAAKRIPCVELLLNKNTLTQRNFLDFSQSGELGNRQPSSGSLIDLMTQKTRCSSN